MKLDLPVMLLLLLMAAGLQTLSPGLPGTLLKPPLLSSVALYYALHRQPLRALVAAAWAGILLDALGGVPPGTSTVCLLLAAGILLPLRRVLQAESWLTSAVLGAALAWLLTVVQVLALRPDWVLRPTWHALLVGWLLRAGAGACCAVGVVALAGKLDQWAGNVQKKKEIERGR